MLATTVLAEQDDIEMASVGDAAESVLVREDPQRLLLVLQCRMGIYPGLERYPDYRAW